MAPFDGAIDFASDDVEPAGASRWAWRLRRLLAIHDLHLAPIDEVGTALRRQHDPEVASVKCRLEEELVARLNESLDAGASGALGDGWWEGAAAEDVVTAVRRLATTSLVPPIYDWLADDASADDLWQFIALEGGPDGGFDDFVAIAQLGLSGQPKLEMARNYWDELGRGSLDAVHTELHRTMAATGNLPTIPRSELPVAALERQALGTTLATNRWLQPELVGALGLIELQAGPRCRRVAAGLRRIGAPACALPFYDEHATTDPRHGKDWLDHVIKPLAGISPRWAGGMVRGACWRATVNHRFLEDLGRRLGVHR